MKYVRFLVEFIWDHMLMLESVFLLVIGLKTGEDAWVWMSIASQMGWFICMRIKQARNYIADYIIESTKLSVTASGADLDEVIRKVRSRGK